MRALVVYESMYGNTKQIAQAIAEGLRSSMVTELVVARDIRAGHLDNIDLVVVGAPTHAWSLSRPHTREGAAQHAAKHPDHRLEPGPLDPGVREWLGELRQQHARHAAAFDTRFDKSMLVTGSAARSIRRGLRRAGFSVLSAPRSFTVTGMAGPLTVGERERASEWGAALGRRMVQLTPLQAMPGSAAH